MKNVLCTVLVAWALFISPVWAQNTAIIIKDAEVQAKLKEMITARLQDEPMRVVPAGEGNIGIFLIHLNPGQTPQEPISLSSHNDVSEVYYVIQGEGILFHGGTFGNPAPRNSPRTSGPGQGGPSDGKLTQTVKAGDLFIIPPNTPHQVNLGAKTEMVYLVFRIDPKKHLQVK
jgi:mannose-6-phosphate isomerase-like protein (cupin superfamily)